MLDEKTDLSEERCYRRQTVLSATLCITKMRGEHQAQVITHLGYEWGMSAETAYKMRKHVVNDRVTNRRSVKGHRAPLIHSLETKVYIYKGEEN